MVKEKEHSEVAVVASSKEERNNQQQQQQHPTTDGNDTEQHHPDNHDDNDDDHHHHQHSSAKTYYYAPPYQRQRWGDVQIVPHTDWGDLFFDVFYVAAAYNIGTLLKDTPTRTGLLYIASLFMAIMNIWSNKVYYDGRFYYSANDYYHRLYEIIVYCNLATIIVHLSATSIATLSNPQQYPDMFILCLSILLGFTFSTGRLIEIVISVTFNVSNCHQSDNTSGLHIESYYTALRDIYGHIPSFICVIVATIYSGIQYFSSSSDDSNYDTTNDTNDSTSSISSSSNNSYTNHTDHRLIRFLASSSSSSSNYTNDDYNDAKTNEDHVAVWLLLGGVFGSVLYFLTVVIYFTIHSNTNRTVPVNVNFIIKRYGEWIMLMLGESILSLLIVDIVEKAEYYATFICGLISIMLLHYLHYQSQPSDPNLHAYRRSKISSFIFYWGMQIYSFALIVFGTCYKMLLYEFIYEKKYDDATKNDTTSTATTTTNYGGSTRNRGLLSYLISDPYTYRFLAGGSDDGSTKSSFASQLTTEERQQIDAHFFAGSLAMIFVCLDVISLAHRGFGEQWKRCNECHKTTTTTSADGTASMMMRYKKYFSWSLVLCRGGTIAFVASLSQWMTDPTYLSVIGVAVIVLQLLIRFAGYYIFHSQEDAEEKAIERVIQYNIARIDDLSLTKKLPADTKSDYH